MKDTETFKHVIAHRIFSLSFVTPSFADSMSFTHITPISHWTLMTGSEFLAKPSGLFGETEHLLFHGGHIQMCVAHLSKHALIRRQRQGSF